MISTKTFITCALLATALLGLLPTAQASAGDFFETFPSRGSWINNGVGVVCPSGNLGTQGDHMDYRWDETYGDARQGAESEIDLQARFTDSDEECVSFDLTDRGGQFLGIGFNDEDLGNAWHWTVIAVGNTSSTGPDTSEQTITLSGTTELTGSTATASDILADHVEKAFWLGFGVLFLMNRWVISGVYFVLGAFAQEATWAITDEYLYVVGVLFVIAEWLIYTRLPQFHESLRRALREKDAADRARRGGN